MASDMLVLYLFAIYETLKPRKGSALYLTPTYKYSKKRFVEIADSKFARSGFYPSEIRDELKNDPVGKYYNAPWVGSACKMILLNQLN